MQLSICFAEQSEVHHNYVLQRILGRGKFIVYHATSTSTDRELAIKVFNQSTNSGAHYEREKKFLNQLAHKNLIKYYPIAQHNLDSQILATEYTPHYDFFDVVTQGGLNSQKLVRTYFHQLVEGLEALHSQNISHCDLKLENFILDKDYNLRIIDFDQAQAANKAETNACGTIGYRAPELVDKKCRDFKASDIFSAGIVLFAFVTGEIPFADKNTRTIRESARYEIFRSDKARFWRLKERDLHTKFGEDLKELLNGMWDESPERRFKIDSIKNSEWYKEEIFTEEELKTEAAKAMSNIKRA